MARGKTRLDRLVLEKGLASDLARARSLILSGSVLVDDRVVDKVGVSVSDSAEIRIRETIPEYVSRGAYKLLEAFRKFEVSTEGKLCVDWGASTGGFTQVLLEKGAFAVFSFDVGYGQMASRIANDPRVTVQDRFHIRDTDWNLLTELWEKRSSDPFPREILLTMDLSFISLRSVLPTVQKLKSENPEVIWTGISLFKPQFEVSKSELLKGVVKDPRIRWRAIRSFVRFLRSELRAKVRGLAESPITGRDGNREILVYWML
ncbi:TlyA family RNA methyltransferase [Leptospira fluminis]|uniref:TlyA family RNA methyltransferase n=1 Tax=Leptospira fluminis TaxID=2484979 RepID=A0A4R9GNF2_9LEPT|nr:TlyA family RNA methyltransferase [Leptospira fluminis]TGK18023.1 TlyA family RNA methyltransferase [Leptospira fluminis]